MRVAVNTRFFFSVGLCITKQDCFVFVPDKHSSGRTLQGQLSLQKDYKDFAYSTIPRHRLTAQKHDKKKGWFKFGGGKKSKR